MSSTLSQIVDDRRRSVDAAKRSADFRALESAAAAHLPRGFRRALQAGGSAGIAVIAELKKASPSRGLIRADFHVAELASELAQAGASALSVLTEEKNFQGSLENLRSASAAVSIPCLRKDFMVDEFQVLEARANRADAILLIVAALSDSQLHALYQSARARQLDVLFEVHDRAELDRALAAGAGIVGVNSRNLHTFDVDLNTALKLANEIPAHCLRVAESGIHFADDVQKLRDAGFQAFLIGESLMKAPHPGDALRTLIGTAPGIATTN